MNEIPLHAPALDFETAVCGFVGLGLIGGSIARAMRARFANARIIVYDADIDSARLAVKDGVADTACARIDERFAACDLLFLCAPVACNSENLALLKPFLSPSAILTDVGSVKTPIHEAVRAAGLAGQFVGGHPMTGSERTGYRNSKALLLENAYYCLTTAPETDASRLETLRRLVEALGAIPLTLDAALHDYLTGAVSHLPHVISATLVNLIQKSDNAEHLMKTIAAGGFKDITRISSSSPVMWQQICMTNSVHIVKLLTAYIDDLTAFRDDIEALNADALLARFSSAREYRESFADAGGGPIAKEHVLYTDIADRPGALAEVFTLLSDHAVNVKNIGITHNREIERGVLRMEFYSAGDAARAMSLLSGRGFFTRPAD